jgi:hypothetical protein
MEVMQCAFHISNVQSGNIPSTGAREMSKPFPRNVRRYYAVPHSLILGKAGKLMAVRYPVGMRSMLLRNVRCSLNDTATCN